MIFQKLAALGVSLSILALAASAARAADVLTWDSINLHGNGSGYLNWYDYSTNTSGSSGGGSGPQDLNTFGQINTYAWFQYPVPSYYPPYGGPYAYGNAQLSALYSPESRLLSFSAYQYPNVMSYYPSGSISMYGGMSLDLSASFTFTLAAPQQAYLSPTRSGSYGYVSIDQTGYSLYSSDSHSFMLGQGQHTLSISMPCQYSMTTPPYSGYGGGDTAFTLALSGFGYNYYDPYMPYYSYHGPDYTTWYFPTVYSHSWFDPPATSQFTYTMDQGCSSLFTGIDEFPSGFADPFTVSVDGRVVGYYAGGSSLDFLTTLGHGVSSFTISDINPTVDAQDSTAFPLKLAFDTDTASFSMTSPTPTPDPLAAIPEPASLALLGLGAAALLIRRRRPQ